MTARQNYLRPILHDLRSSLKIETVADVGCGVGYFSGFLHDLGFNVIACDGRSENVEEARRRYPNIEFKHSNVEDEWTGGRCRRKTARPRTLPIRGARGSEARSVNVDDAENFGADHINRKSI